MPDRGHETRFLGVFSANSGFLQQQRKMSERGVQICVRVLVEGIVKIRRNCQLTPESRIDAGDVVKDEVLNIRK
jgi:hypothetical protein